jgi:hypothetical protein
MVQCLLALHEVSTVARDIGQEQHGSSWRWTEADSRVRCDVHGELDPGSGGRLSPVILLGWPASGKVERALLDQLRRKLVLAERARKPRWSVPRPQQQAARWR